MSDIYMLFAGDDYYPAGGTEDLVAAFRAEDDEAAKRIANATPKDSDWWFLAALDEQSLTHRTVIAT